MSSGRRVVMVILGVAMFAIGLFVAVRPLWTPAPITGARWLDMAFAIVFMLRGAFNIRTVMLAARTER